MAVCGIYFSAICSYTSEYTDDFTDLMGCGDYSGDEVWRLSRRFRRGCYMLDSEMIVNDEKMAVDSVPKGKKPVDPLVTCVVSSCQGQVTEILFSLTYSIHQHAVALDVIQFL